MEAIHDAIQLVLGTAANHYLTMLNMFFKHLLQVQNTGLNTIHQGQNIVVERRLERGHLVELVQDLTWVRIFLQFDHDTDAFLVRFIAEITNAVDLLLTHQIGNLFQER